MRINYEGDVFEFDLEDITVRQAMYLQAKLDMTLLSLDQGLSSGDPRAILAIYWLMRTLSSDTPVDIDTLDFKVVKLSNAIQEAVEAEQKAVAKKSGPKATDAKA